MTTLRDNAFVEMTAFWTVLSSQYLNWILRIFVLNSEYIEQEACFTKIMTTLKLVDIGLSLMAVTFIHTPAFIYFG
jgi:hypothetical protein